MSKTTSDTNAQAGQDELKRDAAKRAAKEAGRTVKDGVSSVATHIRENPLSVKAAVTVTGIAIIILSFLGFLNVLALVSPIGYVLNVFMMLFGQVLVIVEGPEDWDWCGFRSWIFEYFGFMRHPVGRAIFCLKQI